MNFPLIEYIATSPFGAGYLAATTFPLSTPSNTRGIVPFGSNVPIALWHMIGNFGVVTFTFVFTTETTAGAFAIFAPFA